LQKRQSATALEASPDEERRSRLVKYTVAMSVRMVCIVLGVVTQGWLMWVFFALAIFLPYFAVIIANEQSSTKRVNTTVIAPKISIKADQIKIDEPK
jgi:1,4-dihydroxy-2-naphthoate octaprenyltransferase